MEKQDNCSNDNEKIILCVGSVYVLKNQKQLIDAVTLCNMENERKIRLHIVGDGPDLNDLKEYVKNNKLSFVEFFGRLSHEDVSAQYLKASVVALVRWIWLAGIRRIQFWKTCSYVFRFRRI